MLNQSLCHEFQMLIENISLTKKSCEKWEKWVDI